MPSHQSSRRQFLQTAAGGTALGLGEWTGLLLPLSQGGDWDDLWIRPQWRLDMHAGYAFDNGLKLDLSVSNLTRNCSDLKELRPCLCRAARQKPLRGN